MSRAITSGATCANSSGIPNRTSGDGSTRSPKHLPPALVSDQEPDCPLSAAGLEVCL